MTFSLIVVSSLAGDRLHVHHSQPGGFARSLEHVATIRLARPAAEGGIGAIPTKLASQLEVRLSSPVRPLVETTDGVDLVVSDETVPPDAAVLAAPAPIAAQIYPGASDVEKRLLATPYSTTMTVVLVLRPDFAMPRSAEQVYGILVP